MTFGASADWLYVLCRTDPESSRHRGLSLLLVPAHQPGVSIRPITNMVGDGEFCEVFFDGARTACSAANLVVGARGDGWKVAMAALGVKRGEAAYAAAARFFDGRRARAGAGPGADRCGRARPPAGGCLDRGAADAGHHADHDRELVAGRTPGAQAAAGRLYASVQHQRLLELATELLAEEATVTGDGYGLESWNDCVPAVPGRDDSLRRQRPGIPAEHHRRASPWPAQGATASKLGRSVAHVGAAGHVEHFAGDEGGAVGGEEGDRLGNVGGAGRKLAGRAGGAPSIRASSSALSCTD